MLCLAAPRYPKYLWRREGEAWITVYVYFVLAKCEGLKSEVMWKSLGLPLRRASRAERVRKLFDREDTFGIVAQHLL
jgi:hypothetical protein